MVYFFCYRCVCTEACSVKKYFNRVSISRFQSDIEKSEEEQRTHIKQLVYILLNAVFLLTIFLCLFDYFFTFFTALRVGKDQSQSDSDKWPQPSKSVM